MIRFLKSPQPATLFVIPVIVFLFWIQAFFTHPFVPDEPGSLLYNLITSLLNLLPDLVKVLITIGLISFEAIYLNSIFNKYEVLEKNSYLPAFMYVLQMSFALPLLQFHPVLLVNLVLLRALDKIFMLFKNDSPISPLFDSCFLISIASLFYFPATVFFVLFLISLVILRTFNFREWMISFIGFVLPYFFLSVYLFWTNHLMDGWKDLLKNFIPKHPTFGFMMGKPLISLFVMTGFLVLLATRKLIQNFYKNTVRTRSYQQILLLFFFFAAASSLFLKTIPLYQVTLLTIPLVVFLGYYFLTVKKRIWFSEMLLWLMIVLIIWNHI